MAAPTPAQGDLIGTRIRAAMLLLAVTAAGLLALAAPAPSKPVAPTAATEPRTAVASAGVAQPAPPPPAPPPPTPPPPAPAGPGPVDLLTGLPLDLSTPASPAARPSPAPGQPTPTAPPSSCGMFDISACVSEAFTEMLSTAVTEVLNSALEILSNSLLQTPRPSTIPRLASLWDTSWQIAMAAYGTVICVGGLIVMAHQSMQSRLGVREILPRLMVGFLAGWLTLPLADMAVSIANAISDEAGRSGRRTGRGRRSGRAPAVLGRAPGVGRRGRVLADAHGVDRDRSSPACGRRGLRGAGRRGDRAGRRRTAGRHVARAAMPHTDPLARW